MGIVSLSSDGQIIIPAELLAIHNWATGQEWEAIAEGMAEPNAVSDGILLKPKTPFPKTSLSQVAGCLKYQGQPKTLAEMDQAVEQGVKEYSDDRG
ncbi:MAG: AbrB/MazE/SpoVT family DNA-binding domain-containing protein [Leptolyngbyaceae bacterium]|nr:AbrB/MazE/SpoVT family DNA-binding domain-containing protein [Leptolyngbyaceae bacterium]